MSRRKKKADAARGSPFVEVESELFINLAFDLPPFGEDVRLQVAADIYPDVPAESLMLLRALTAKESKTVRKLRLDAELEAWAMLTA